MSFYMVRSLKINLRMTELSAQSILVNVHTKPKVILSRLFHILIKQEIHLADDRAIKEIFTKVLISL
jgi:hypothetical protein